MVDRDGRTAAHTGGDNEDWKGHVCGAGYVALGNRLTSERTVSAMGAAFEKSIRSDAPNWQPWLMFFMRALQQQKRRLAAKVEREKDALDLVRASLNCRYAKVAAPGIFDKRQFHDTVDAW